MKQVPYFSQWESRKLISDRIAQGAPLELQDDPLWASSGASTQEEYVKWASHLCGMVCLKMILAARSRVVIPTLELARACTAYGGYVVNPETGEIEGLIYAPFVRFINDRFGIDAEVVTSVTAADLPSILQRAEFFMASVHPSIRWPERHPPARGGHLVLVIEASTDEVMYHNPSGHTLESQEHAIASLACFDRFFAGRGVAILR